MLEETWLNTVLERVQARNEAESDSFRKIFTANTELWKKCVYLDACRVSINHNLAVLEHETADFIARNDYEQAVKNMSKKINLVTGELQPYKRRAGNQPINLSKVVYDQRKTIGNLEEELRVAKFQISETFTSLATAQETGARYKDENEELQRRVSELEQRLITRDQELLLTKAENKELTVRIITEKNKSAAQLDEMNKLLHRK